MHTHIHSYICIPSYIHRYIHTFTHTYTHTHLATYTSMCMFPQLGEPEAHGNKFPLSNFISEVVASYKTKIPSLNAEHRQITFVPMGYLSETG